MNIIGPPSAKIETVCLNVPDTAHKRFVAEMLPALWVSAKKYYIDPVGMVAQAYKETGGGNYPGKVKPEFYNTAGIKIRHVGIFPETTGDQPLAHQMFPSWAVGARAHAQHLRAYAGWPVEGLIVDPRYLLVGPPYVTHWSDLGGRWAPNLGYGVEIETLMLKLTAP